MEKKYQVFISSTYSDLINERQTAVEAILNAGHIPAGMELFKAGQPQEEIIKEWIEESDIYILILGPRYGSLKEENLSYTNWEYNFAKEMNKPMFSIVLTTDYLNEMSDQNKLKPTEFETNNTNYKNFKDEVMSNLVYQMNHIAELRGFISDGIRDIEKRCPDKLKGWVSGEYLTKFEKLESKNKELFGKLVSRQDEVIELNKTSIITKDDFIGEFTYNAVVRALKNSFFDVITINKRIKALELESEEMLISGFSDHLEDFDATIDDLKNLRMNQKSMLDYLILYKRDIESGVFELPKGNLGYLLGYFFIPILKRFNLIFTDEINKKILFTNEGKKFITLLEFELNEEV